MRLPRNGRILLKRISIQINNENMKKLLYFFREQNLNSFTDNGEERKLLKRFLSKQNC